MAYFNDCLTKFGYGNFFIRWLELIFAVMVLVFGGVLPLEKIDDGSFDSRLPYDGIYNDPAATRFAVFAGAFGTACAGYIILTSLISFLQHGLHYWFVLVLDILNWIFFLSAFASLSSALSRGTQALRFCSSIGGIINTYKDSTPRALQIFLPYLQDVQLACNYTYAGIAFGVCAWLLWTFSIWQSGRMLWKTTIDEDPELNTVPRQSASTDMAEHKDPQLGAGVEPAVEPAVEPTSAPVHN